MATPPWGKTGWKLEQIRWAWLIVWVGNECDEMDVFVEVESVSVRLMLTQSNMVYVWRLDVPVLRCNGW